MAANPLPAPILNPISSAWKYIKGQCTYYVAQAAPWIPGGLGNAADWLANARQKGLHTSSIPKVGSVVVYGRGHGYDPANGHVALVTSVAADLKSFTVNDQNYDERGGIRTNAPSTMNDVLGFIEAPGSPATGNTAPGSAGTGVVDAVTAPLKLFGWVTDTKEGLPKLLRQGGGLIIGAVLITIGLGILLAREFLNVRKPEVSVGPAKLSVLDGGKKPAAAAPAPPVAKKPDVPVRVHGGKDFTVKRGA